MHAVLLTFGKRFYLFVNQPHCVTIHKNDKTCKYLLPSILSTTLRALVSSASAIPTHVWGGSFFFSADHDCLVVGRQIMFGRWPPDHVWSLAARSRLIVGRQIMFDRWPPDHVWSLAARSCLIVGRQIMFDRWQIMFDRWQIMFDRFLPATVVFDSP